MTVIDRGMQEETEEKHPIGILIPGLVAGGIAVAIAWVHSPLPGVHYHIPLYDVPAAIYLLAAVAYFAAVKIAIATYYAMAFLYGFMPATGVAYLVRQAYRSLKGRSHEKGSVPIGRLPVSVAH